MIRSIAAGSSIVVLLIVLHDAFEVMLLPRRVKSRLRLVQVFFRSTWALTLLCGRIVRPADRRHHFLSLYGPLSMVGLLTLWAGSLIAAFGTLQWTLAPGRFAQQTWLDSLYFSGVTFFTLGYGDIVPHTALSKFLSVLQAGCGLAFLATVVGYLPVLYQLFSRREARVIMLDALAGSPPTALTLLARHAESDSLDELKELLRDWQHWAADLLESQISYPMLAYYRSQHDNQSWLAAVAAIMDSCALLMVGMKGVPTFSARVTFSTARQCVVEMGRVFQVGPRKLGEDRLDSHSFAESRRRLEKAGLQFVNESEAEQRLAAFRNTYEPFLNGLAHYLSLELPPWFNEDGQLDNWQNSPRGKSAKQLVESLPNAPES